MSWPWVLAGLFFSAGYLAGLRHNPSNQPAIGADLMREEEVAREAYAAGVHDGRKERRGFRIDS